ncbi:MAG: hypothetical protein WD009_12060 [Phycisphaeraceae bacterium]
MMAAIAAGAMLAGAAALAEDEPAVYHWLAEHGGLFQDPASWDVGNDPPSALDMAVFDLDAVYIVSFNDDAQSDRLRLHAGDVTFALSGHTYELLKWTLPVLELGVNDGDDATLRVQGGVLSTTRTQLGIEADAIGQLYASGSATTLALGGLIVGEVGQGRLVLEDGAASTASGTVRIGDNGGTGEVIVRDGATWTIGALRLHNGTILIEGGSELYSGLPRIGFRDNTANMILRDPGTRWISTGVMAVGSTSETGSSLRIENGALLVSSHTHIGGANSSDLSNPLFGTVTVTGPGATWQISDGPAYVAVQNGLLEISDGGLVSAVRAHVGQSRPGELRVTGEGSRLVLGGEPTNSLAGMLTVAAEPESDPATANIEAGGHIESNVGYIGTSFTHVGEGHVVVRDAGSSWTAAQGVYVGGAETQASGSGSLTIINGATVDAGNELRVWTDGALLGNSHVTAAKVFNAGLVAPGLPADPEAGSDAEIGTLTLDGDYQQMPDGTLRISLANHPHSQLIVTQNVALAGTLEVNHVGDAGPALGEPRPILTAAHIDGTFDQLIAPDEHDTFYMLAYSQSVVTLTAGLIGDMNMDGVVDATDVAPFVLALTDPSQYIDAFNVDSSLVGDINRDGVFDAVDVAPFVALLVGGDSQAVPEPGTAVLLSASMCLLLPRRRGASVGR